jgi:hypothetical protein
MQYSVFVKPSGTMSECDVESLTQVREHLQESMKKGSILSAYVNPGAGLLLIVDQPDSAHLHAELRKHHIIDAEITELFPLLGVLDAYIGKHSKTTASLRNMDSLSDAL